jgi:predicted acetyltransferase
MTIDIRTITDDELEAFSRCQNMAFGRDYNPDSLDGRRKIFEFDRNYAAFDGSEIAGTCGINSHTMGVPGGSVKSAGVTMVSVKPTHRRRGVLTAMMAAQLDQVARRGEPVATLWASESLIYGRFGYGLASEVADYKIARNHARLRHRIDHPGTVRQIDSAEARETWPTIWDEAGRGVPGFISRSSAWWDSRIFRDPADWRDGYTANNYISYDGPRGVEGYLRYRTKAAWDDAGFASGSVRAEELMALTPAAYAALWEYALSIDLVTTIEADFRRPDEPLMHMLEDPRRLIRKTGDGLWVRVVDVEAALSTRRYSVTGRVVLGVTDTFRPAATGSYVLEGGPDGATCRRTDEAAEVHLEIAALGAAYLGSTRLGVLAEAGRVTGAPAAIALADAMFAWRVSAWCPEMF